MTSTSTVKTRLTRNSAYITSAALPVDTCMDPLLTNHDLHPCHGCHWASSPRYDKSLYDGQTYPNMGDPGHDNGSTRGTRDEGNLPTCGYSSRKRSIDSTLRNRVTPAYHSCGLSRNSHCRWNPHHLPRETTLHLHEACSATRSHWYLLTDVTTHLKDTTEACGFRHTCRTRHDAASCLWPHSAQRRSPD